MANYIIFLAGILVGAGLLFVVFFVKAPGLMIFENESRYTMAETEERITKNASELGWKIPVVHDLQQTMDKNGFQVMPVRIMELCKPVFANEILSRDQEKVVSSLMPCRIAIYQKTNGKVYFSRLNSGLMAKPMKGVVPAVMKSSTKEIEQLLLPLKKN